MIRSKTVEDGDKGITTKYSVRIQNNYFCPVPVVHHSLVSARAPVHNALFQLTCGGTSVRLTLNADTFPFTSFVRVFRAHPQIANIPLLFLGVPRRKTFPDNPCEPISKSTSNPSNSCYSNFTLICPNKLVALKDALPDFSDAATPLPLRQQSLSMRLTRTSSSSRRLDRATGSTALDRYAVKHVKNLPIPFPRFRPRPVFTTPHLRSRLCRAICTSPHARALSGSTHNRSRWMLASLAAAPHLAVSHLPYPPAHGPPSTLSPNWRCAPCALSRHSRSPH
jgi:hypothetical protein